MTDAPNAIDILARPGGNDQVITKKVLLAALACDEAARLALTPNAETVAAVEANFLGALAIHNRVELDEWLNASALSYDEFKLVMRDFAAVVVVEHHHASLLGPRIELHRRVVTARERRISALT
ncbi:MAG: hypothetical protein EXR86_01320 [Gammaproteobacteria bacterium]|nr:hypothetical protein [Gammaproteobacteria bacterium]